MAAELSKDHLPDEIILEMIRYVDVSTFALFCCSSSKWNKNAWRSVRCVESGPRYLQRAESRLANHLATKNDLLRIVLPNLHTLLVSDDSWLLESLLSLDSLRLPSLRSLRLVYTEGREGSTLRMKNWDRLIAFIEHADLPCIEGFVIRSPNQPTDSCFPEIEHSIFIELIGRKMRRLKHLAVHLVPVIPIQPVDLARHLPHLESLSMLVCPSGQLLTLRGAQQLFSTLPRCLARVALDVNPLQLFTSPSSFDTFWDVPGGPDPRQIALNTFFIGYGSTSEDPLSSCSIVSPSHSSYLTRPVLGLDLIELGAPCRRVWPPESHHQEHDWVTSDLKTQHRPVDSMRAISELRWLPFNPSRSNVFDVLDISIRFGTPEFIKKVFSADYIVWFAQELGTTAEGIFTGFFGLPGTIPPDPLANLISTSRPLAEVMDLLDYIWISFRDELLQKTGFDIRVRTDVQMASAQLFFSACRPEQATWLFQHGFQLDSGSIHPLFYLYHAGSMNSDASVYHQVMLRFWHQRWLQEGHSLLEQGSEMACWFLKITLDFESSWAQLEGAFRNVGSIGRVLESGALDGIFQQEDQLKRLEEPLMTWLSANEVALEPVDIEQLRELAEYYDDELQAAPKLLGTIKKLLSSADYGDSMR